MQEDVNGVLARMINTSACKQPSNVSTLRCKMNRWKAPLIANIPRAQSPFLPRRAAIATAVPAPSSLGATGARAGVGCDVTRPGWGRSVGSGSRRPADLLPWVRRRAGRAARRRAPRRARVTESQNHRMVRVGSDLCGSPSPTPCRSRVTPSRLHRTVSRQVLNISREGDSTTSLGSLFQCSVTLRGSGGCGAV